MARGPTAKATTLTRGQKKAKAKAKEEINPFATVENHSSDEPLLLDADATAVTLKHIASAVDALGYLHELVSKGTATVSTRHNALGIARYNFKDLEKILGAKDDLKQHEELDRSLLRQANMEVHRLREELGKGVTIEAIGNKLYQLDRTIYNWWQNLGFSYSSATLAPHSQGAAFKVQFSINIDRHISSYTDKPVTARANRDAKMAALGEQLEVAYEGSEPHVVDNENNRAWVTRTLKGRFPTCRIWKWESISVYRLDVFQLRHVEVNIDITDIGDMVEAREEM